MMGLRAADYLFRGAMGLIVIGWIAWMMMLQADYRATQEVVKPPKSKPTQTFVNDPVITHDPQLYNVDPYSRPTDDAVGDHPRPTVNDWGN